MNNGEFLSDALNEHDAATKEDYTLIKLFALNWMMFVKSWMQFKSWLHVIQW